MKLTFLGTAAANAFPEAFCACANCEAARALGGPSLRKRSAALVNDDLLIDLGPDIMAASQMHGRPLTGVRYCLQTHGHADHLDPSHLLSRSPGYGVTSAPRLHFYASRATAEVAARLLEPDVTPASLFDPAVGETLNLEIHIVEPLQPFSVGGYRAIGFPTDHDDSVEPLLYSIEGGGRTLFYGTDTAPLPERIWEGFHRHTLRFDLVILDHTYGPQKEGPGHLSAAQFLEQAARMRAEGLLAEGAKLVATHIAHDGNPAHPELVEFARANGYEVAYDGWTV